MKSYLFVYLFVFHCLLPLSASDFASSEEAYRANNLGVALLEQYKHEEAVERFKKALELKPDFPMAKINLAIALYNAQKLVESKQIVVASLIETPQSLQANFILGLIWRTENDQQESLAAFRRVVAIDPKDVGANVNIGQIFAQQRQYDEAIKHFQIAYDAEPYNTTAIYNLATALQRTGERERAAELLKTFQIFRENGAGTSIGLNYLEQGRYAEAAASTGAESELVDNAEPKVIFHEANIGLQPAQPTRSPVSSGAVLFDMDGDQDLDLALTNPARIFRNDKGKFINATAGSGDYAKLNRDAAARIIAGDFDNDNLTDLFLVRGKSYSLYKNLGKGKFSDVTVKAKIPAKPDLIPSLTCAFVDVDHDGDLDIFVGGTGKSGNRLFRNNGDSTFKDYSAESGLNRETLAVSVVPTDFDNRRDIDLMVLASGEQPGLYRNLRDTTFRDVASQVGLNQKSAWTCAAAGDFNKDTFVDFFFGVAGGRGVFAVSDGRGKFEIQDAPAGTESSSTAQFLDYDNDGLLDLIAITPKGFVVSRNLGNRWTDASSTIFKATADVANSSQMLSADTDGDGDVDLMTFDKRGSFRFFRNDGGNANNAEILRLQGRVSNKTAFGAKIDMRSGSLAQKLESYSASPAPAPSQTIFGLGKRVKPDAVRVIWSSGIVQSEIDFPATVGKNSTPFKIEELDRKPSSCPYLYTWNGERFEFITDFLGGGEMGNWAAAGVYHQPDSDEFVRIASDQLKPRNGRYEIRVTNELEEVLFLDNVKLFAVEHDADSEVYPNEGLGIPTSGKQILYTAKKAGPPLSAMSGDGKSVLPKIEKLDRNFYDSFKSLPIRGYAKQHELTLNLDDKKDYKGRTLLLLTGWTDYAFSSDNLAAAQSGKSLFMPYLQVKNANGEWQTVIENIGISVGRPQTIVVDLTGKFLTDIREVRIVTNFKTYWDKIEVDTSLPNSNFKKFEMRPMQADLRERGFSEEVITNGMISANYNKVLNDGRWKYFAGRFTRFGDVNPLLSAIDDTFVISKTGDEIILSFAAISEPPTGRKYTFLLYADGYSKEMDINSGSPEAVFPLPFKGMANYPYSVNEKYPMTREKENIYELYNTRLVRGGLPKIEAILIK
jgi:tetratricopeptide (TPR) repeat protein